MVSYLEGWSSVYISYSLGEILSSCKKTEPDVSIKKDEFQASKVAQWVKVPGHTCLDMHAVVCIHTQ